MKTFQLVLFLISSCAIYAQESGKILYSEEVRNTPLENEKQNISFKLENDSLFIKGRIIANCCGSHFLEYKIYEDSIFLSRTDDGELCDCYGLYNIDIKIGNCPSIFYKIKLDDYNGHPGFETEVNLNQTCINDLTTSSVKCYLNPAEKQMIIELLGNKEFNSFVLYDSFGRIVKKMDFIDNEKLFINTESLASGIYLFRLFKENGISRSEKIIIL